jgi:uncharacterized protein YukE
MPIDTHLDGDPASIRAAGDWLGTSLAARIDQCVTDLFAVRDDAARGWQGDAGSSFQTKMDTAGRNANQTRADAERAAQVFNSYADDLTTAQNGMERARQGGLELAGDTILDPGAGPAQPAALSTTPTIDQAQTYNAQMTAYHDHQSKVVAYAQADTQEKWARGIIDFAKETFSNAADDLVDKWPIQIGDFVNDGVIGGATALHTSILKKQAEFLRGESDTAVERYLKTPGGTPESKALNLESYKKFLEADKVELEAENVGRSVEGKLPVVGLALTAVDIGYDIHTGKPVGKAIVSGVGGAWAAMEAGAVAGTFIGGPVGTVAGAVIGIGVGLVVSGGLDALYDQIPAGTQKAIEGGFDAIGHGVADAGEAVGHTASKVWHSIFYSTPKA